MNRLLLPSYDVQTIASWEEEPLVNTSMMRPGSDDHCILQELSLWATESLLPVRMDSPSDRKLWGSLLPKEIVVASGHVELHTESPYVIFPADESLPLGGVLLPMKGDWKCHDNLYTSKSKNIEEDENALPG